MGKRRERNKTVYLCTYHWDGHLTNYGWEIGPDSERAYTNLQAVVRDLQKCENKKWRYFQDPFTRAKGLRIAKNGKYAAIVEDDRGQYIAVIWKTKLYH